MFWKINLVLACLLTAFPAVLLAAEADGAGTGTGYLDYREPAVSGANSVSSTFFYILSLVFVFVLVLLSAYFVSKFIGRRFGKNNASGNIMGVMPLEQNKKLVFLQLNESLLVLGVTEQSISLLKEFEAQEDIARIKKELFDENTNNLFGYHSKTLGSLQDKIRPMLRNLPDGKKGEADK